VGEKKNEVRESLDLKRFGLKLHEWVVRNGKNMENDTVA